MIAGIVGAVALAGAGALGAAGLALFDFALNPRSRISIFRRRRGSTNAGGVNTAAFRGDDRRARAYEWFELAKQDVAITPFDGGELHGWWLPAEGAGITVSSDGRSLVASGGSEGRRMAVLCHGYDGQPSDLCLEAHLAHQAGLSVLLPAARGFERNADRFVTMGWHDATDLLTWLDLLVAVDPGSRIALYGISMGGGEVMMASGLPLPAQVRCIVEDCGYTSVWDQFVVQIQQTLHLPPVPLLNAGSAVCRLRAGFGLKEASAVERLRKASVPMLFIHGTSDTFVPFSMLDEVYEACGSACKEKLAIEGARHALSSRKDPSAYYGAIADFLGRYL